MIHKSYRWFRSHRKQNRGKGTSAVRGIARKKRWSERLMGNVRTPVGDDRENGDLWLSWTKFPHCWESFWGTVSEETRAKSQEPSSGQAQAKLLMACFYFCIAEGMTPQSVALSLCCGALFSLWSSVSHFRYFCMGTAPAPLTNASFDQHLLCKCSFLLGHGRGEFYKFSLIELRWLASVR